MLIESVIPTSSSDSTSALSPSFDTRRATFICIALALVTIALYAPVRHYDFVKLDDNDYVFENAHVIDGLTRQNVLWAFTRFHSSNWHPLTWLSHMIDVDLWGLKAGGHHITNVFLHAFNSAILFWLLLSMTGATWRSAFVAAIFAFHPLHVESVAWISERKDVLSVFFWLLTMAAYLRYARRPGIYRYILILVLFAGGLMSKSMVVTLPIILLFLDYWPLNRATLKRADTRKWLGLLLEKAPLVLLSLVVGAITLSTQQRSGSLKTFEQASLSLRLTNIPVSYVTYLWDFVCPSKLAVFYPLPSEISWWKVTGAIVLLVSITLFVCVRARRTPFLLVGWLWYVATLLPVSGLIQVGDQAMADRYAYIPFIGIAIACAWGTWRCLKNNFPRPERVAALLSIAIVLACVVQTSRQLRHWRNTFTLFQRALSVTSNNFLAHNNLSNALLDEPDGLVEAELHAREALRFRANYPQAHINLGISLLRQNKTAEAIEHLKRACEIAPNSADAHANLGAALMVVGNAEDAIAHLSEALRIDPELVPALKAMAWTRATFRDSRYRNGNEAIELAERAARITKQSDPDVLGVLAAAYAEGGRFDDAVRTAEQARNLALKNRQTVLAEEMERRLDLFQLKLPYRPAR